MRFAAAISRTQLEAPWLLSKLPASAQLVEKVLCVVAAWLVEWVLALYLLSRSGTLVQNADVARKMLEHGGSASLWTAEEDISAQVRGWMA